MEACLPSPLVGRHHLVVADEEVGVGDRALVDEPEVHLARRERPGGGGIGGGETHVAHPARSSGADATSGVAAGALTSAGATCPGGRWVDGRRAGGAARIELPVGEDGRVGLAVVQEGEGGALRMGRGARPEDLEERDGLPRIADGGDVETSRVHGGSLSKRHTS
jgi:hypothetical protein